MKLLPTCTFNFTPSSLFLFLFARLLRFSRGAAQVLSLFFLLLLLPFPLLSLNLLNECSLYHKFTVLQLSSYSFSTRSVVCCYRLFPYGRPLLIFRRTFSLHASSYTTPHSFHGNIENSLWTSFIPRPSRTWSFKVLLVELVGSLVASSISFFKE